MHALRREFTPLNLERQFGLGLDDALASCYRKPFQLPKAGRLMAAYQRLQAGGVIAYPTESCFGLGCDPFNVRALKRVLALKARPMGKGLVVIAAYPEQLRHLILPLSGIQWVVLRRYWPGHYTFLLPASPRVPPWLRGQHDKLAVRITAHAAAAALCRALGTALVSTSANRAGKQPLRTCRDCRREFGNDVLTLPGMIGGQRNPSTIIDFATGRVLR